MQSFDCNPELCAIYELCQAWDKHYDKTCIIHTDYDYEGVTNISINQSLLGRCKEISERVSNNTHIANISPSLEGNVSLNIGLF